MKRFSAEAALIVLLVIIGSSLKSDPGIDVDTRIEEFEHQLHRDAPWEETGQEESFYAVEENKASSLALSLSQMIIEGVGFGTLALTDFFTALFV